MPVFSHIGQKLGFFQPKLYFHQVDTIRIFRNHLQKNISSSLKTMSPFSGKIRPKFFNKDEKRDFMAIFPDIVRELTLGKQTEKPSDLGSTVAKILQYNVSTGKHIRGLSVVYSYRMLAPEIELTSENIRLSQIVGWCVEMINGFFLVVDDLTDKSETRRQRPCWYKLPDVGLRAASDAIVIEAEAFHLLQNYIRDKPYYINVLELFLDSIRKTSYGQLLDSVTSFNELNSLTMDRYNFIIRNKTSYYTFHLPVAVGMYMAGIDNKELHRQAKNVLLEIGNYFQVQDDYFDVFGDEEITGKRGSDIQDGKCTWLVIIAFQRASPEQRAILKRCYGKPGEENIEAVKDIFLQIGLPKLYNAFEEETYNLINCQIQQLSAGLPHELFLTLLNKIHGRKK